jgi:RNA recognition motif-containing protein
VVSAKIIRNKHTGYSEGYGFVEFRDRVSAETALRSMNGVPMPGARGRGFRLNWASFGVGSQSVVRGPARNTSSSSLSETNRANDANDAERETDETGAGDGDTAARESVDNSASKETSAVTEHSAFVGDLPPEVNDFALQETFAVRYKSVRNARVVTDPRTGRSKGFGFVRFSDEAERDAALTEMHGAKCGSRLMRLSLAVPRKQRQAGLPETQKPFERAPYPGPRPASVASLVSMEGTRSGSSTPAGGGATPGDGSPERGLKENAHRSRDEAEMVTGSKPNDVSAAQTNVATVFVGGLDPSVRESDLLKVFEPIGALVYVKIPRGKGCGFAQFLERTSAEKAIAELNGAKVGNAGSKMRLSWVRSNSFKNGGGSNRDARTRPSAPYFVDASYGYGHHPGMIAVHGGMEFVPGGMGSIPGGMGMEFGAPAYFPAPGGGWMTPGGGWVPAPPPGYGDGYGQAAARDVDESSPSFAGPGVAAFASSEEAYAFAQRQYFAAQQRARYEAAAFYGGANGVSTDGQSPPADAALAPNPPPTPPGAKKASLPTSGAAA